MATRSKGQKRPSRKEEVEFISVRSPRSSKVGKPPTETKTSFAIGLFVVVTAIFFFSHLTGSAFLWEDFAEQFCPFQAYAAHSFSSGTIPFWNPYTFSGMPFFAELQNGYFYPGHILMYLFSNGKLNVWLAQFFIILHYFLAMFGMWKLAGEMKVSGWGRLYAGISYGLSGMLVAHMIHANMLYHFALFPLIFAFFWRGVNDRSLLHALFAGLTLGLAMLSGHPQIALYIIFFLFCATLFVAVRDIRSEDQEKKRSLPIGLGSALVTVLIGVGISAVQYLPTQELAERSLRAEMTYEESVDGSLEIKQLVTLVTPKIFGVVSADMLQDIPFWLRGGHDGHYFWETVIFVGVVTLLLALLGLASGRLRSTGWFIVGMALFGLAYGMGDNFFIHPIVGKLPFFSTFRAPARMAIYFTLGASLLAGVGLDRVIQTSKKSVRLRSTLLIGGGLILLIALLGATSALFPMLEDRTKIQLPSQVVNALSLTAFPPLLIGLLAVGIIWCRLREKLPAIGTATALLFLCIIDLMTFGIDQNTSPMNPETTLKAFDKQYSFAKPAPPAQLFRVWPRSYGDFPNDVMTRNQGPYSRIMSVAGFNTLALQRAIPPAPTIEETMALLNVKYRIVIDSTTGEHKGMAEIPTPYPHAWLVHDYQVVSDEKELENTMKSGTVDLSSTVLLEEEPLIKPDGAGGEAQITKYEMNHIELTTKSDGAAVLVLSEIYYPAWKAYVDGEPAPLYRANWSLRAIPVPSGEHRVEMRFESEAFATGSWITLITLIGAVAVILFLICKKKKGTSVKDHDEESMKGEKE